MKLRWTNPALRDLEAIGDYVAQDNPAAAAKTVIRILEPIEGLATHPYLGRVGCVPNTRKLIVVEAPFIAPYRIRGENVEVLALFHGARRWPEKFD